MIPVHCDAATQPVDALAMFGSEEILRDPYPFLTWLRENDSRGQTMTGMADLFRVPEPKRDR